MVQLLLILIRLADTHFFVNGLKDLQISSFLPVTNIVKRIQIHFLLTLLLFFLQLFSLIHILGLVELLIGYFSVFGQQLLLRFSYGFAIVPPLL